MRYARLAAVLLAVLAGQAAAQRVEAGLVDSLTGPPGRLRVLRDGVWTALSRLQPVYQNDSIAADSLVEARLRLYGHGVRWLCGPPRRGHCSAGLRVGAPGRRGGLGAAVRGLLTKALEPLFGGEQWSRQVSTIGRGTDEIAIPLLAAGPAIGAGTRTLGIAWEGGTRPWMVQVLKDGDGRIAGQTANGEPVTTLGGLTLVPGEYGIRIEDARGIVRLSRFQVLPAAQVPRLPREYDSPDLVGGARVLLESLWLAGLENGRWAWEAWLRLGTLGGDPTAERIRRELAAGRLPPPPRATGDE